jgi:protease-4
LGQTSSVSGGDYATGARLPPTSAALADEATALSVNPAGLSAVRALSFFYVHERNVLQSHTADGLYLAHPIFGAGAGFSMNWLRSPRGPDIRSTGWGLSLGGPNASVGASVHFLSSRDTPDIGSLTTYDLGALVRPSRGLSLGFVARNVSQPEKNGYRLPRQFDAALAIRPVGERLTLAVDWLRAPSAEPPPGRLSYTAQAELIPGLLLAAGASHHLRDGGWTFQTGITLNEGRLGIGYAVGGTSHGLSHILAVRASADAYRGLSDAGGRVILVDLDDALSASPSLLAGVLGLSSVDPYLRLSRLLEDAQNDFTVRGVILKVGSLPRAGAGKVEELRGAVSRLRQSGKKVVAVLMATGDLGLQLASACDRVYALAGSRLQFDGLSASYNFLGGSMDKLGVKWDVARVGAYKNAPDQLTRSGMSIEQREAVDAYLDSLLRSYRSAVAEGRRLSAEKLTHIFEQGLIPSPTAVEMGAVDEIIAPEQLDEKVEEQFPGAQLVGRYSPRSERDTRWGPRKRIAVIPVLGTIASGKSRQGPFGIERIAGAETVARALKSAEGDPRISGILLRVDSGGGDALASELMYRAVLEAKKSKPVVASMGDVAASGGYYAAAGADEIVANPTTLTGSIGVFYIKPALEGLANKLGVRHEILSRGPLVGLTDLFRPWGTEEKEAAQKWVDFIYDNFINDVANARRMPKEKVNLAAQGRVWSGEDAKARGLVDGLGGLDGAVAALRQRAGISPGEPVEWVFFGEPHGLFASPGGEPGIWGDLARAVLPEPPPPPVDASRWMAGLDLPLSLLTADGPVTRLPFTLKVE